MLQLFWIQKKNLLSGQPRLQIVKRNTTATFWWTWILTKKDSLCEFETISQMSQKRMIYFFLSPIYTANIFQKREKIPHFMPNGKIEGPCQHWPKRKKKKHVSQVLTSNHWVHDHHLTCKKVSFQYIPDHFTYIRPSL